MYSLGIENQIACSLFSVLDDVIPLCYNSRMDHVGCMEEKGYHSQDAFYNLTPGRSVGQLPDESDMRQEIIIGLQPSFSTLGVGHCHIGQVVVWHSECL